MKFESKMQHKKWLLGNMGDFVRHSSGCGRFLILFSVIIVIMCTFFITFDFFLLFLTPSLAPALTLFLFFTYAPPQSNCVSAVGGTTSEVSSVVVIMSEGPNAMSLTIRVHRSPIILCTVPWTMTCVLVEGKGVLAKHG
jgi:hypothetical protein